MIELQKYSTDISKLCSLHKVKSLHAFGSVLSGRFGNDSDIDLIVDFKPVDIDLYADNYYDLKFSLQDILQRKIDLLEAKAIKNPFFLKTINKQRQLLYGH